MKELNLRNMVSISMDGPNVNWKFFELLQQEHAEQYGGVQLVNVGSCGLHTLHNAFKCGFSGEGKIIITKRNLSLVSLGKLVSHMDNRKNINRA